MKKYLSLTVIFIILKTAVYSQETLTNTNTIDNTESVTNNTSITNTLEEQSQTNTSISNSLVISDTNYYVRPILDKDFLDAEKLFFEKKYYISRRAFLKYLEKDPLSKNDMLYFYLGTTYFIDKDYKNAIDYYKIALDLKDSTSYYNNIANSYYQLKNYKDALDWYKKAANKTYSPYSFEIIETMTNSMVIETNYITNIVLNDTSAYDKFTDKYFNNKNTSIDTNIIFNTNNNITNSISNTNIDNAITNEIELTNNQKTFEEKSDNIKNITDRQNKIESQMLFHQTNIFTSLISTNIVTNYKPSTNISLFFSEDTNSNTNAPNEGINPPIYYSPYLHLGHTYLALKEYTNASIYYEIYLTNVGSDYYQFAQIENVINIIRNKNIEDILNPKEAKISTTTTTNSDGSITVKDYSENIFDGMGGIKESVVTTYIDGNVSTFKKYNDGSTVNIMQKNDGSLLKETIFSNGKKDIESISSNGSLVRTSFITDGTKHIYSTNANNEQYIYTQYLDGSAITKLSNAIESSTLIERIDGSLTKYRVDKDGTIEIYTLNTDNSELQRIEYPDKKISTTTTKSDGTTVNRTDNADGTVLSISKNPDGSIVTMTIDNDGMATTETVYVDGSMVSRVSKVSDMDKIILLTSKTRDIDGSIIIRTIDESGTIKTVTRKPDARIITEEAFPDGTIIIKTEKADGSIDTKTNSTSGNIINIINNQDGSVVKEEIFPDGTNKTETTDKDGNINTTIKNIDGSIDINIQNIDGTYEKNVTNKDGSSQLETLDKNGSKIKILTNSDSSSETTIDKKEGSIINIKKNNDNTTTLINFYDGSIYTLIEQSGKNPKLIVENSDILDQSSIMQKLKEILDYRVIDENIIDLEINNTTDVPNTRDAANVEADSDLLESDGINNNELEQQM